MKLNPLEPPLPFCQVGRHQHFPAQYARTCPTASVPPPCASSRVSAAVLIHRFNQHQYLFCCPKHIALIPHLCSYPPRLRPPSSSESLLATHHRIFLPRHLLTHNRVHISLFQGGDAATHLHNKCFIDFSYRKLSFASIRVESHPMSPPVQSRVRYARLGYHLRPVISTAVCSMSYHLAQPIKSSLRHPIISVSLCRPLSPCISAASPPAATVFIVPEYLPPTVPVVL